MSECSKLQSGPSQSLAAQTKMAMEGSAQQQERKRKLCQQEFQMASMNKIYSSP